MLRNWLLWQRDYEWPKRLEQAQMAVVWRLPRWIVGWSFVRVFGETTTGPLSGVDCATVPAAEVYKAWERT